MKITMNEKQQNFKYFCGVLEQFYHVMMMGIIALIINSFWLQ